MIVGSILLAFGLQAWWEGRQDREFEQEALARLEVEFSENLSRLPPGSRFAARTAAAHELIQAAPSEAETVSVPDTLLAALFATGTFDRVTPVLDGLIRSGRWELIRDPGVREAVAQWERWFAQLAERQESRWAVVDTRLIPALAARAHPSRVFERQSATSILSPSDEVTVVRVDNELKALVAEAYGRYEMTAEIRAGLRARTEDVLAAISRSRGN